MRVGAVGAASPVIISGSMSPSLRLAVLGLSLATGSASFTIEELADSVIRVYNHGEMGYLAEARLKPDAMPVYHYVSKEMAERIQNSTLSPADIAHLFTKDDPVDA
jgi:hypothetical protein